MQSEEQRLIDGLFSRLQQAEQNSAARDTTAENIINTHLRAQPAAPYYMAQTILIQEAALRQLNEKVQQLEQQVNALQSRKPESGGFLAGLFGGGRHEEQQAPRSGAPIPGTQASPNYDASERYAQPQAPQMAQQAGRSGGFMAGALQTAAGVAGGVMLGNMLTSMFHNNQPQEIVNIIEEPVQPAADTANQQDTQLQNANNDWQQTSTDDADIDNFMDESSDFSGDDDFGGGVDDSGWF